MSFIEKFNYNRDSIVSGDVFGFTGSPIYGSSITFSASNSSWRGSNYYQFIMPNGLNSIKAEMSLNFQGNKENIKSILRRIENATTGILTGDIAFSGTEDCINFGESKNNVQINLDTGYYKNFSGSQISNYNLKHISSDVYELNLSMFNNRVSPVLSNGMGFVADRTVDIVDSSFEEFDVAKFRDLALFDNDAGIDAYVHYGSDIINLPDEFDISFSVILSGYNTPGDSLSGAHFLSQHTTNNSRIFYFHNNDEIRFVSSSAENIFGNTDPITLDLNRKYDLKFTRDSSNNVSLFIDGSQIESSQSNAGNFIFGRIGGPWNGATNIPPLNGTIFDISVKSGSNLTEVFKVAGNGTGVDDWSSDINGYDFDATIFGSLENYELEKNSEIFNNYFYLTGSRSSRITASSVTGLATYTGFADDSTRTFFWEPDQQVSLPVNHSQRINELKNSFHQQLNISRNQNRIDQLQLRFTNRGEKETYAILHFLESHLGYKNFVYYYDDNIINPNRVFYCPNWKHTFNYKNSNTIEATFVEIVAPVTPEF
tara:strand:+ start:1486 stop:3108 length:1623 start_codon:yes stop_codon:yes gene_type:complete